jgi:predicted enzyme related to lactoylglutathione lyase
MGERTSYAPGTFSWVDLNTDDIEASKAFYADLLGWTYQDIPIGDGNHYSMAQVDGHNVAAITPMPPGMEATHWNCYVTVEDADGTAARAKELGGTVMGEVFDVFDAGRMAIVQDPQGAVLMVWQPRANIGAGLVNAPGALCWNDLIAPDVEASAAFYRELFGWTIEETPGAEGAYWSITNGGRLNGGVMPAPPDGHPVWNLYFAVEDCDAAVARAGELGGELLVKPRSLPNGGRFAVVRDPQGAIFSVTSGPMDP